MQHTAATVTVHPVPLLDSAAQAAAWVLGKVSCLAGAGVFWVSGGPSFWDAWTDADSRTTTVRLGRLELATDWRA
jgi:hypothetical protein